MKIRHNKNVSNSMSHHEAIVTLVLTLSSQPYGVSSDRIQIPRTHTPSTYANVAPLFTL